MIPIFCFFFLNHLLLFGKLRYRMCYKKFRTFYEYLIIFSSQNQYIEE